MTVLILAATAAFASSPPSLGDGGVFATVPDAPGFPEGIALDSSFVYVTTQARFGTAGGDPSEVLVFRRSTGALYATIEISGEDLDEEHALSGVAIDDDGDLYVLSTQLGVVRLSRDCGGWTQSIYAPAFEDLNPSDGIPPLPNDPVFDDDGNLYVSDSLQGVIWRVEEDGGEAEVWLADAALAPGGVAQLGVNGLRPSPDRAWMYLAVSGGAAVLPGESDNAGKIYRIPLQDEPSASDLELVYTYGVNDLPDGLAFSRHGDLYVALAGADAISILDVASPAIELDVFTGPSGSAVPFTQPSNLVFDSKYLLVVNHAVYAPDPTGLFAVLEVYAGERGDPLPAPDMD